MGKTSLVSIKVDNTGTLSTLNMRALIEFNLKGDPHVKVVRDESDGSVVSAGGQVLSWNIGDALRHLKSGETSTLHLLVDKPSQDIEFVVTLFGGFECSDETSINLCRSAYDFSSTQTVHEFPASA